MAVAAHKLAELSAASLRDAALLNDATLEAELAAALAAAMAIGGEAAKELARLQQWRAAIAPGLLKTAANYGRAFFNYRAALEGVPITARSRILLCCAMPAPSAFALACLASCRNVAVSSTVMCLDATCKFPLEQLRSSTGGAPLPADAATGEWTARLLSHALATPCASTGGKRPKNDGIILERAGGLAALVSVAPYLCTGGWLVVAADVLGKGAPHSRGDVVATLHALFKTVVFAPMAGGGGLLICREFAGVRKAAVPPAMARADDGRPIIAANAEYVRAFAASCVKSNVVTAAVLQDSPLTGGKRCVHGASRAVSPALFAWKQAQEAAVRAEVGGFLAGNARGAGRRGPTRRGGRGAKFHA